ncbi:lipopolysaccharide biosynthesis protein [Janthinobacterium fluminis]|uniref:Lipopolysaccharide biosynthesis protein n=1 Tax=Janthinobacterium fluminis TaxID=2987524 RepID=A0ABT5K389_9BURK|nr:lipopolysaccharide biosynthesis protein [Janthinobacterium fluminis]MDC8758863.1 lipopolysaccharide biosynthesis protein [Janthinobacterium fluminis]
MDKYDEYSEQYAEHEQAGLSLTAILPALWRGRWLIAGSTAVAAAIGLSTAIYSAQYLSEGFFQFGGPIPLLKDSSPKEKEASSGITLPNYKRYSAAFNSGERFREFVQQNKLEANPSVAGLQRIFSSPDSLSKLVQPVFPFTKLDAKELMEQPKDASNNVIGLRIVYQAENAETARRMVSLLGRYTMDSIIYLIYSDALRFKHSEITARISKLDNDIIENKEKLELFQRKGANLKQIIARYPDSANQAARQVISINEDSARYLSPLTQLMTSEVDAADATEAIRQAKREQKQNLLLREYYDQAKILLDGSKSGEAVVRGIDALKQNVFKDKDLRDELVQEIFNKISIENQLATSLYLEKSRFIAGPSLPENRSTRLSTGLLLGFVLGLFGSTLVVLGHAWWLQNREKLGL